MSSTLSLHLRAVGDASHCVGSFLDAKGLAAAEQARALDALCVSSLWADWAARISEAVVPWSTASEMLLPPAPEPGFRTDGLGKRYLREVRELGKCFDCLSAALAPSITALSPSSVKATPFTPVVQQPRSTAAEQSEDLRRQSGAPVHACSALRLGVRCGCGLAAGVCMSCKGGHVREGCCFGLEAVGCVDGCCRRVSYVLAPASGRCFVLLGGSCPVLCADALPPVRSAPSGDEDIEVWVRVAPEGDVLFLRRLGRGPVEATDRLPRDAMPAFATEYHAAVHFFFGDLGAPTTVSIIHAGEDLPDALQAAAPTSDFSSAGWHVKEA